jgi:Patatin-like phospholipase
MAVTHRFAFTISGGLALGAYEAGVLAQLYRDFNSVNRAGSGCQLVIDAISGASAGSITGLILAQALALGSEPDAFEQQIGQAWVEGPDISALLQPANGPEEAIFTQARLEAIAAKALEDHPSPTTTDLSRTIALWMAITNVDGIPIRIVFPREDGTDTSLYAFSYRDYAPYLICGADLRDMAIPTEALSDAPHADPKSWWDRCPQVSWQEAVRSAIASGSFPVAFRTKPLKRDLTRYGKYNEFKQSGWPDALTCQTMDGGIFGNEPIGKAIDAVSYLERIDPDRRGDQRTYLIIEPNPNTPDSIGKSLKAIVDRQVPDGLPVWTAVLQMISAYFNDALYSDFVMANKVNAQLRAIEAAGLDEKQKEQVRKAVGLDNKKYVALERIPHTVPTKDRLAGVFFGDFGGFLQQEFRDQDFHIGRQEARHWLVSWLTQNASKLGASPAALTKALGENPPEYKVNGQPVDLSDASWCRHMTEKRRNEITNQGLDRLEQLVIRWLRLKGLKATALRVLRHVLGGQIHSSFVECRPPADKT